MNSQPSNNTEVQEPIKILMIEDDPELAEILAEYLEQHQITIENYEDPFTGISALNVNDYDLMILDLTLPGMDGLEVCKKVAAQKDIPIIISSARGDTSDKIIGLDLGADDYLPKPYDPKELYARIKSVLRRHKKSAAQPAASTPAPKAVASSSHSRLHCDPSAHQIYKDGEAIKLTLAEYEILAYLIQKNGHVVSRDEFVSNLDSLNEESSFKSIDVIMGRIRSKLDDSPKEPQFIEAVRGVGYRLIG